MYAGPPVGYVIYVRRLIIKKLCRV